MSTNTIQEVSVVNDFRFKEMLFSSEGQQTRIPFTQVKNMKDHEVINYLIDFFAEARPGWGGKMLSTKALKGLYAVVAVKIQEIHE